MANLFAFRKTADRVLHPIVSGLHGNVLRLQPPLTFTNAMVDQFCAALKKVLQSVRGS